MLGLQGFCAKNEAQETKAAYSGLPFGASFSLLASRAHIPIDERLKYNAETVTNKVVS
jgi:hypothetical protein